VLLVASLPISAMAESGIDLDVSSEAREIISNCGGGLTITQTEAKDGSVIDSLRASLLNTDLHESDYLSIYDVYIDCVKSYDLNSFDVRSTIAICAAGFIRAVKIEDGLVVELSGAAIHDFPGNTSIYSRYNSCVPQ
jgi:hypothetical protein